MRPDRFLTSSDIARFCQVDTKTVHNWADKDQIPHFRTPGRHLRFRPEQIREFLERHGYPVPPSLLGEHDLKVAAERVAIEKREESIDGHAAELDRTLRQFVQQWRVAGRPRLVSTDLVHEMDRHLDAIDRLRGALP